MDIMTKPTFIFFGGLGWAGTTSLYYTLTKIGYMHGGIAKEYPYLERTDELDPTSYSRITHLKSLPQSKSVICSKVLPLLWFFDTYLNSNIKNLQLILIYSQYLYEIDKNLNVISIVEISNDDFIKTMKEDFHRNVHISRKYIRHNLPLKKYQGYKELNQHPALAKFTPEDIESIFQPISIENYSKYYKILWKYCQETNSPFKAVGDFANVKYAYTLNDLKKIKESLEPYFNVKAIQIFRDPLRRSFSCCSARVQSLNSGDIKSIFEGPDSFNAFTANTDYAKMITTWREAFGKDNYHYVIMEDFFNPDTPHEVKKLEEFLQISIAPEDIHPCAFVPDKGINAPKLDSVRDQWASDIVKFDPETYTLSRYTSAAKVYKNFKKLHGYLPADWGRPIDYGYND